MTALLDAALSYAARGWYIYPGYSGGKGFARVKWATQSSRDPEIVRQWWTDWPCATICLNCGLSGLAVIDLDVKDHDGPANFAALRKLYGAIPPTLRQRTGSGGRHLFFQGEIKTTGIYQRHRYAKEVREAFELWSKHIDALITVKAAAA